MFLLLFLIFGFSFGLIRAGSLRHIQECKLRCTGLVLLALLLQIVAFSPMGVKLPATIPAMTHVLSYVLLVIFLGSNLRQPGFSIMGVGLLSNSLAIAVNDGYMPILAENLIWLGLAEDGVLNNSVVIGSSTPLWWLGDIFLLPLPLIGNVFSVGDVFIGTGAAYFAYRAVRPHT